MPRRDGGERRLYLIETAEKGLCWMRLRAHGRAGHGSMINDDNAVTAVAEAVARLGRHRFPLVLTDAVLQFLAAVSEETGHDIDVDSPDLEGMIEKLGPIARIVNATLRDTATPTMLHAGYKANVIPATAEAVLDCRVLPGRQAAFEAEVDELIGPYVTREWVTNLPPVQTTFDGDLVDAMNAALLSCDPDARTVPYMLSGELTQRHSPSWVFGASASPATAAAGSRLLRAVPRRRRARSSRRAGVRHPRAAPLPDTLLTKRRS